MSVLKNKINSMINDKMKNNLITKIGIVLYHDTVNNIAAVSYKNHINSSRIEKSDVPVLSFNDGISYSPLLKGEKVLLLFGENDSPIIIGKIDLNYKHSTKYRTDHDAGGAYLPLSLNERI